MTRARRLSGAVATLALLLSACGGGGGDGGGDGGGTPTPTPTPVPTPTPTPAAGSYAQPSQQALTIAEVQGIVARAVAEAQARNLPSVIAVVDRVGNVLAVFTMNGARPTATTAPAPNGNNLDAQNVTFPATMGAISKAITGAYLSSGGNAFSTRTASRIVQEHFPVQPNTAGLESGPLFGVQFSSLPCSDLVTRYSPSAPASSAFVGPKRAPLGLSADPGGLPLYKNGVVVGGIGVMGDGVYGSDDDASNVDTDDEEYIALAGTIGFEAPVDIRGDRISVDSTFLGFIDAQPGRLRSTPASAPAFAAINGTAGVLTPVTGYYQQGAAAPAVLAGTAYGTEASGYRRATAAEFRNTDAFVLSDGSGASRYPFRGGTDSAEVPQPLTAAEVTAILEEAFVVMSRARAQIRKPQNSRAQMTISVVDTRGQVLGLIRAPDAPLFGTDVSLQKARTAAFFSSRFAASDLQANASADVRAFVGRARDFLGDQTALTGGTAFSARAHGLLSRPYFPDGEIGRPNGPFSRPIANFNPFSTGLQSALIIGNLGAHIGFVAGSSATDTGSACTTLPEVAPGRNRLMNGIQIFPGGVPIYRGSQLVGGIGVSGDGIDQDDMASFLGTDHGGARGGSVGNAASAVRADRLSIPVGGRTVTIPYIQCPFGPFLDTTDQDVCRGK